jgi:DNA-binding cell septation regulator SpoVG
MKRRRCVMRAVCFAAAVFGVAAAHAAMPVTAVAPDGNGTLAVTFAGRITVSGVLVTQTRRSGRVIHSPHLPRYVARTGREYPQVEVLSPRLRTALVAAVVRASSATAHDLCVSAGSSGNPSFEVRTFQFRPSSGSVRASAEVVFEGELSVSCRIMEGRRGPWVAWPSERDGRGGWRPLFKFEDAAYGRCVEKELLDRYRTGLMESTGER